MLGAWEDVCVRAVSACGVRGCGVRARRESGQRRGCGGEVPGAAGGRCALVSSLASARERGGSLRAVAWGSGRHSVFPLCWVWHAWTWAGVSSGGPFRAVAPVAISGIRLLLRGRRVGCGNVPNNAYDQGGQELGASAGGCRAHSLACARFRPLPVPPPPARLSVTLADVFLAFACFEFYLRSKSPMHKKKLYNFTISEPFRNNSSLEKSAPRS